MLMAVADKLGDLTDEVTFVGGSVVCLLATDPDALPPRGTQDVDAVVEVVTRMDYYKYEERLRSNGFQNDMFGPVCRLKQGILVLDLVPIEPDVLGFSNRWYPAAVRSRTLRPLPNGKQIFVLSEACFIATKFEAFRDPSRQFNNDLMVSHDFEDILVVVAGNPNIADLVDQSEPEVRNYIVREFQQILANRLCHESIEAHFDMNSDESEAIELIYSRMQQIAALAPSES